MKKLYFTSGVFLISTLSVFSQLNVTPGVAPATLVSTLIGPGVTPSNITTNGATPSSQGTFTCPGGCNVGFTDGILLTSGSVTVAASPNTGTGQGAAINDLGDPQLASLTTAPIHDASTLEFDFWVASDSVRFNYIFASDEYSDYTNSPFNDVFGFFINGPSIPGIQNIAKVPITGVPVTINNVNNGGPVGHGTPLPGPPPISNPIYFRDNQAPVTITTAYDGLTTPLTAAATICPCETYHIKLAVSDANDQIFDSGVFLEGNSFASVGQIEIFADGVPQPNNANVYVCDGQSVTLSVLDNLTCSVNYTWSSGANTQTILVNQGNLAPGGIYACTVTHPSNPTCFAFTTFIHVIYVTPTASITGINSICAGGSTTLTANLGSAYSWSTGATTQSITVSTAGNYTVTVTSVNGGCTATSAPFTVTVGGAVANITGVISLCNGAATTLTANLGLNYLWSTGATTQAISAAIAGAYTVTVTQAGGCTASASVNVVVNPNPVPNITGTTSICQGTSTLLDAGAGYASYQWSNSATTQTISASVSGTYTVTVTDANGCTGTDNIVVAVNALPAPVIAGITSFCQGDNSTLNAGAGYSSYLWSTTATTQTINVTTAGNYTVTVTNGFGCSGSTSVNIVVNANPVPIITGISSFCQGSSTTLDAGAGYSSYLWSNSATTQTIGIGTTGTFTVTVTDANGCTGTTSANTVVNPLPVPVIAGITAFCQGDNTTLDAGAGYTTYQWSTSANTQTINTTTAGTYTVTVTDGNGCTGSTSVNIVVNPLPTPAIAGVTTFCQGNSSTLNAGAGYLSYLWSTTATTQTINVTTAGNYTVTVTNGFGCSSNTNVNIIVNAFPVPVITGITAFCQGSSTTLNAGAGYTNYIWSNSATTQTIGVSNAGTFTVTVTNSNGCTGTTSSTTVVNPLPVPAITGVTTICQGSSTIFDAGGGYAGYIWSSGALTQTINASASGSYTVTVTDVNGCTAIDNISLTVNQSPAPVITGTLAFCQGNSSTLDAGPGYNAYLWSTGATTRTINVTTGGPYTVTVTDINTCTGSDSKIVNVNSLPTPAITGGTGICAGNSATLNAGNGYATYQWSTGSSTQTINVSAAGNYTVTVTDMNGCTGSANTTMVVNPLPVPVITGVTSVCQGTATTFDAGTGYSLYAWSTGSGTQTINTTNAGTYTVTVTDVNGCTGSDNISLVVNPLPVPAISGNTVFCSGNSSTLNAGAGFNSYLWSTGVSTQTINVSIAGNYSVVVTNGFSCSASANVNIVVNPLPNPVITGGTSICFGSSTTLNAGNGYANYNWSTGATSQTITVATAGSYSVTVTDNNGCSNTTSTIMMINALPVPVITGITAICQGAATTFDAGTYSSYLWSTGATTQTISPGAAGNYIVTVTDANGCTGSDNINLLVNALPTPAISGNTVFCQGDNTTLNAGAGYTSYTWSNGGTTQIINTGTAGNYSVIVEDGNGCTASALVTVVVNPLPTPVITGTNAICQGTSSVLNGGNYAGFVWSTGATTQSINTGTAGNYIVTVTDNNGCVNSSSPFNLTVYPLPTAVISQNSAICIGASSGFNISFIGTSPFTYTYSANGTNFTGTTSSNPVLINVTPSTTTTYTLISVTDAHCAGSVSGTAIVTVNSLPTPVITGINVICDGASSTFNAGSGYSNYLWSTGDNSQTISVNTAGNYTVTVTDGNGCINSDSQILTVNQTPVASFTNDTSLTCEAPIIHFTNTSSFPAGSVFAWDFGDGSVSTLVNPSHIYTNPGTYPISLTITSQAGCVGATLENVDIQFYPLPVAEFKPDPNSASVFSSLVHFTDMSQNAITWNWDFGDDNQSAEQNPKHYFDEIGKYHVTLMVTNIAGCVSKYEQEILITPFFVPNAFTPNGDGLNEVFFDAGYIMDVSSYNMTIWSRWGQKVYENDAYHKPWRGIDKSGKVVPEGSYVYQINVMTKTNKKYSYEGTVNLIR